MKCEECGGTGKVQRWFYERTGFGKCEKVCGDVKCEWCNGTGEVEQTNEEWLRSCPPQELIRFLMNVAYGGQIRNVQKRTFDEEAEKWSKWLKEKHTE